MLTPPQPKDLIGSKDSAMKESQIAGVLTPILAQFGLELEAVEIIPAGKRRLLRVVVDGDGPEGTGHCWMRLPRRARPHRLPLTEPT